MLFPPSQEAYEAAMARMRKRLKQWRKDNPNTTALVQFRADVHVVGAIYLALQAGLVTVNEGGYDMLRTMCSPEKDEPTVMMVRQVIDNPEL